MMKDNKYYTRVEQRLEDLFKENNWEETELTMKSSGLKIKLTPHFQDSETERSIENIGLITAYGPQDARLYTGTPYTVINMLIDHDNIHHFWLKNNEELKTFYFQHEDDWTEETWRVFANEYFDLYRSEPVPGNVEFD